MRKVRLTGGEPLVRRDIMELVEKLGGYIGTGLEELTLTTNGSQLAPLRRAASPQPACAASTSRSIRSTRAASATITRRGRIADVLDGIDAAAEAGLKIKINMVAMRGVNDDEIEPMMHWAHGRGFGLTLIEGMPLGEVGIDRVDSYLPLKRTARAPRRSASRSSRPTTAPAARRATISSRKPRACSASSRR